MATHNESATAPGVSQPVDLLHVTWVRLLPRIRKFLWLSSGLFSAASFAIPAFGVLAFGSIEGLTTSFAAAIVSACLFGLASLLHFGPDVA
ncbi:MAG: hypothetical protein L3J78_00540 [Thermoplasmata archaeon]|nr:hypothetical protein [Thermoplasmata archaeon]